MKLKLCIHVHLTTSDHVRSVSWIVGTKNGATNVACMFTALWNKQWDFFESSKS
jgi:hypothetical protein